MDIVSQLKLFLEPKSIALVGLPRGTGPASQNVMEFLQRHGYQGAIYPINPNCPEILGRRAYACVKDLPEIPDLAVIMTPRHVVAPLVRECGEKGIRAVIVVGQGFADGPAEGKGMQEDLVSIARSYGTRIVGPNTFGAANAFINFNTAFAFTEMRRTPVGVICQSGLPFAGFPRTIVVGKVLDVGNTSDVDFGDGLEYFARDDETRVVLLYLEGIRNGRRFMEVARKVTGRKPVIALKAGRGLTGARVASSHSGSLTGEDRVYDAAFKQCGILRAGDTEELTDLCRAFVTFPPSRGRHLGVLTFTMGGGTMVADACEKYNMSLATFSKNTMANLASRAPSWLRVGNPVDCAAVGFGPGGRTGSFRASLEAVREDPGVDSVLVIMPSLEMERANIDDIKAVAADGPYEKPVALWVYGPDFDGKMSAELESGGRMLNFLSLDRAIRALARMAEHEENQRSNIKTRNDK